MVSLPSITVITPSYNQVKFLEKAILSVLGQYYPRLEYFVIDGGSFDGSIDIIKKYDKQIAWWTSEKDEGQSYAINKGLKRANGDIICWINSDDFLMPGAFYSVAEYFSDKSHYPALLYGSCFFYYNNTGKGKCVVPPAFDYELLQMTDFIVQPSAFWNRKLLEKVGLLNESLHYAFDWEWFLRAGKICRFQNVKDCFSCYCFHDNHKSSTGSDFRRNELLQVVKANCSTRVQNLYESVYNNLDNIKKQRIIKNKLVSRGIPLSKYLSKKVYPSVGNIENIFSEEEVNYVVGMMM